MGLKPYELGFVFFTPAVAYTVITPLIGYICNKYPSSMPFLMMGSTCVSIIGYSILGPLPFIDIPL